MDELMKFFHARKSVYRSNARRFDEAIYTPYTYDPPKPQSVLPTPSAETGDLLGVPELNSEAADTTSPIETRPKQQRTSRFHNQQLEGESEIYLFEYGVSIF